MVRELEKPISLLEHEKNILKSCADLNKVAKYFEYLALGVVNFQGEL